VILYPAIDIRDGHAVRLLRGDYEQETVYDADPTEAARRWAGEGARYLHVVDLDGAREGRPVNLDAVKRIAAAVDVPVQVGGGMRSASAIEAVLGAGAERVVLGTAAMDDPELLREAVRAYAERLVVSVDARGDRVALHGWTQPGEVDPARAVREHSQTGVGRFMFTPIEVDGTMEGPGIEQLRRVAAATEAEVIYSGGVGELKHLRSLAAEAPPNVTGVIVGRALYEGRFSIADAQGALTMES
jgi:phosphoribosylformimino-5-aminoimidazole carboxamide ribotide isomerase